MPRFTLLACAVVILLAASSILAQVCQTSSDCGPGMYCVDQTEGGGYGLMCSATPVYDNGHSCTSNSDCYSDTCTNNVCTGVAQGGSCIGNRQDCLNEPDIQCNNVNGAYICTRKSKYAIGHSCNVNDDCSGGNCASGTCQATAQGQQCNPNNPQCASGLKCTNHNGFSYCDPDPSSSTCTAATITTSKTLTSTATTTKTVIGARSTSTITFTKTTTSTLSPVTQTKTTTVTASPSIKPNGAACKVDCDCSASSYCRITSTNTSGIGACAAKKALNTQCRFDSTCISNYCDHTVKSCKSRPAGY